MMFAAFLVAMAACVVGVMMSYRLETCVPRTPSPVAAPTRTAP
jgi:ABC-type Mn2+/Zn2+ transport system permease subunit